MISSFHVVGVRTHDRGEEENTVVREGRGEIGMNVDEGEGRCTLIRGREELLRLS